VARRTYLERLFPDSAVFQDLAKEWCADQSALLLRLVWDAYDRLKRDHLDRDPIRGEDERKEESLNLLLFLSIDRCKDRFAPFSVIHEVPEQTAGKGGRAQSPHPDVGFCFYENPRAVWPLEGKILESEHDVTAYCAEVTSNCLTGRYATFSNEGAMLGYLLSGDPNKTFAHIRKGISCNLLRHQVIRDRPHRVSSHSRENLPDPRSPRGFFCHHMILEITSAYQPT
jgi:hypothetical protein